MNTHKKVEDWAVHLGYKGIIPDSFKRICNASTAPIWEQLMAKVRPKEDVANVKKYNLIIRLRNKGKLAASTEILGPMKELVLWNKKKKLQKDLELIKDRIKEKEEVAAAFKKNHHARAMKMTQLKDCIKENDEKSFLLREKSKAFLQEISEIEETLTFFRNLTPTESMQSAPDVGDTLRKCAEKIETSLINSDLKSKSACPDYNMFLSTPTVQTSTENIFSQSDDSFKDYTKLGEYKQEINKEIKSLDDIGLRQDIEKILHDTDAQLILNVLINQIEVLKGKLLNVIEFKTRNVKDLNLEATEEESDYIDKIHGMIIENGMYALKYSKEIKQLKKSIEDKEQIIQNVFEHLKVSTSEMKDYRDLYILQRKETGLEALCDCVKKQLAILRSTKDHETELVSVETTSLQMQQKLVDALRNLNHKYELYKKIYKTITSYREETRLTIKKSNQFTYDLNWTLPLTFNLHSREIKLFKSCPLEWNRKISNGNSDMYARNVINTISMDVDKADPKLLKFIFMFIDSPYSPPETILFMFLQNRKKLEIEKSLLKSSINHSFEYKTYTMKELQDQESYIDFTIDKIHSMMRQNTSQPSNRTIKTMQELVKLYLELPFSDYVLPSRLFEGQNMMHHQNMYDNLYKQLPQ